MLGYIDLKNEALKLSTGTKITVQLIPANLHYMSKGGMDNKSTFLHPEIVLFIWI